MDIEEKKVSPSRKYRYAVKKERMANDPEYAAKIRNEWKRANEKRYANETPEEKEARLKHHRKRQRERYREWKAKQPEKPPRQPKPKTEKAPKPPTNIRKPGRLLALIGWRGF